jgi:hypothetical protein
LIIYFFHVKNSHKKHVYLTFPTCSKIKGLRYQVLVHITSETTEKEEDSEWPKLTCPKPGGDARQFRRMSEGGPVMATSIFTHTSTAFYQRCGSGSESGSGFVGSRSFYELYHQAKIVRKTLTLTVLWLLY